MKHARIEYSIIDEHGNENLNYGGECNNLQTAIKYAKSELYEADWKIQHVAEATMEAQIKIIVDDAGQVFGEDEAPVFIVANRVKEDEAV